MKDVLLLFAGALIATLTNIYLKDKTDVTKLWKTISKWVSLLFPLVFTVYGALALIGWSHSEQPLTRPAVGMACLYSIFTVLGIALFFASLVLAFFDKLEKEGKSPVSKKEIGPRSKRP